MENLINKTNVKLINKEKDNLKRTSNPSYMLHKTFGSNFTAIQKIKYLLKLKKPAYIVICILELFKVLIYELYYDYIKKIR